MTNDFYKLLFNECVSFLSDLPDLFNDIEGSGSGASGVALSNMLISPRELS